MGCRIHAPATNGPTLQFPCTQRQDRAISSLERFMGPTDHQVRGFNHDFNDELDRLLVELLEAIFFDHTSPTTVVETIVMLFCMKEDGSFREPSYVTHICTIVRYSMRIIAAHRRSAP
jgi:hypothetical protein